MRNLWHCRRTYVATLALLSLTAIGIFTRDVTPVACAISAISVSIAAANSFENTRKNGSSTLRG